MAWAQQNLSMCIIAIINHKMLCAVCGHVCTDSPFPCACVKVAAVVAVVPLVKGRSIVLRSERDPPSEVHDAASARQISEKKERRVTCTDFLFELRVAAAEVIRYIRAPTVQ
jgi:hypothetical protein